MDEQSVWEFLTNISVGTVMVWIIVIGTIITTICTGTIKLYKIFTKYKEMKDKEERQAQQIAGHENTLKKIERSLEDIQRSLDEQKEVNLKQIRHTIVGTCEEVLEKGEISINKLHSLEEMYEEYVDIFHGNGYVKTLVTKVRQLHVVGADE